MPEFLRAYAERASSKDIKVMRFVASTDGLARDGLVIDPDAWDLTNYEKSPVVLWAHDYGGFQSPRPPIGRAVKVWSEDRKLMADIEWDMADPFAADIARKYAGGYLSAVSVGWDTKEIQPTENPSIAARITKAELLDISAVPVPGDPNALMQRQKRGYADLGTELLKLADEAPPDAEDGDEGEEEPKEPPAQLARVIAPHSARTLPEDTDLSGTEVLKADDAKTLRGMHAYFTGDDPDLKSSYRLLHHTATGEVIWRGVAACMVQLLRADTQIPESDRFGVYKHLARHYGQWGKEPPEYLAPVQLQALSDSEIRGLFLEGEPELVPEWFADVRAGAVLSSRNRSDLTQARDLIDRVLESAAKEASKDESDDERGIRLIREALDKAPVGATA